MWDEDIETFEIVSQMLEETEDQILTLYHLDDCPNIRQLICEMVKSCELKEDDLVTRWIELYSTYMDYQKNWNEQ